MAIVSVRSKPARKEYISQCNLKTVQAYQFTNEGYPQERMKVFERSIINLSS